MGQFQNPERWFIQNDIHVGGVVNARIDWHEVADRLHQYMYAYAYGGGGRIPIPGEDVAPQEGEQMARKRGTEISDACVRAIRDYTNRAFAKEFEPIGNMQQGNFQVKMSRNPAFEGRIVLEYSYDTNTLALDYEEDEKDCRIIMDCQTNTQYYDAKLMCVDKYGYRFVPPKFERTKDLDAQLVTWAHAALITGRENCRKTFTIDGQAYAFTLESSPDPNKSTKVETTVGRWLVKLGVPASDQRLVDLGKLLTEWAARESPANVGIKFLTGQDIVEAYKVGTGGTSCMVGKWAFLTSLYALNPEVCSLALLVSGMGTKSEVVLGRCLLWKIDGKWWGDRVYPEQVKVQTMFREKLERLAKEAGCEFASPYKKDDWARLKGLPCLRLKMCKDKNMPYFDSFRHAVLIKDGTEVMMAGSAETLAAWMKANAYGVNYDPYGNRILDKTWKPDKVWVGSPVFNAYVTEGGQARAAFENYVFEPKPPAPPPQKVETISPKDVSSAPVINFQAEQQFNPEVLDDDPNLGVAQDPADVLRNVHFANRVHGADYGQGWMLDMPRPDPARMRVDVPYYGPNEPDPEQLAIIAQRYGVPVEAVRFVRM